MLSANGCLHTQSTIIDLLIRQYDPVDVEITVDGNNLKFVRNSDWKGMLALVDQDCYLFHDTVFNNIMVCSSINIEYPRISFSISLQSHFPDSQIVDIIQPYRPDITGRCAFIPQDYLCRIQRLRLERNSFYITGPTDVVYLYLFIIGSIRHVDHNRATHPLGM